MSDKQKELINKYIREYQESMWHLEATGDDIEAEMLRGFIDKLKEIREDSK